MTVDPVLVTVADGDRSSISWLSAD